MSIMYTKYMKKGMKVEAKQTKQINKKKHTEKKPNSNYV